jgi:hypothetical protein
MTSIKMFHRFTPLIFGIFFCSSTILGQWTDYGVWSSASISQKVSDNLDFSSEVQTRFDHEASRLSTTFTNLSLSKSLTSNWKLSSTLRLGVTRANDNAFEPLSRISFSVKHKRTLLTNLAASVRFRYQLKTDFKQAFRLSPALYYKVSKKLRLAFYTEFFVRQSLEGLFHSDSRYRFILKYKVSKRRWVSFGYQIEQQKNTPDPRTEHVFICSYDIEMKRRNGKK